MPSSQPSPPTTARVVAAVAGVNVRRLVRDRTTLFFMLVLPLLITLLIGLSIPGDEAAESPLGVVAADGTSGLVAALDTHDGLAVRDFADRGALEAAVRRQTVAAGVVLDDTVAAALHDAGARREPAEVAFLAAGADPPIAQRQAVAAVVADHIAEPVELDPALTVAVRTAGAQPAAPSGFDHTAPANLVLFTFLNTLVSAGLFATGRQLGVLQRAVAAPISRTALLLGEGTSRLLVALLQAGIIIVAGATLFGVAWGDPWAVAAIVGLFALAATGAALVLGAMVRTDAQATTAAIPIGLVLGMLGGALWPREIVGETMRRLGDLTPHGWATDALAATIATGAGVGDVITELAVLAAFAAVLFAAAVAALARRPLQPNQ